jgi:hypothetical protein
MHGEIEHEDEEGDEKDTAAEAEQGADKPRCNAAKKEEEKSLERQDVSDLQK